MYFVRGQLGEVAHLAIIFAAQRLHDGVELAVELVDGVDHGGVVAAAETRADLRQGRLGEIAGEVHGDVARVSHVLGAAVAAELIDPLEAVDLLTAPLTGLK